MAIASSTAQAAPTPPIPTAIIDKVSAIQGLVVTSQQLQALIAALTTAPTAAPPQTPFIEEVVEEDAPSTEIEEDAEIEEAMEVDAANGNDLAANALTTSRKLKAGANAAEV